MNKTKAANESSAGLRLTGVLSDQELVSCPGIPGDDRLRRGPVAVIECSEEIPCNPCESNCPRGAIQIGDAIISRPCLDVATCSGCALCVSQCPGLAIFVVDLTGQAGDKVSLPYEFLPLPTPGEIVDGMDREGKIVCEAEVLQVDTSARNDRSAVVTLIVPKEFGMEVRFFCGKEANNDGSQR